MAVSGTAAALLGFDPAAHQPHRLHHDERVWTESNCYVDLWIEVLHALGLDPHACLGFTLALDFEGDQWTFFKPPLGDLYTLYGIEVQELSVYRSLADQVLAQVRRGRLVMPEVDAFFLPDTRGTDYRAQHSKTTIAIQEIDVVGQRLGYFHNRGYHALSDGDFAGLLRLDPPPASGALPPYVEFAKLDALRRLPGPELLTAAIALTRGHLARLPRENPLRRFQASFAVHLQDLLAGGLAAFHAYAFVTLRQLGACFELAASFVRWLAAHGEADIEPAAAECEAIAAAARALQLKTARAASTGKPFDHTALLDTMAGHWSAATGCLRARYGG